MFFIVPCHPGDNKKMILRSCGGNNMLAAMYGAKNSGVQNIERWSLTYFKYVTILTSRQENDLK